MSGKTPFINISVLLFSFILSLLIAELIMRRISPVLYVGWGVSDSPKSKYYGWAPQPKKLTRFLNSDTGEQFTFMTNSEGWKDVEHEFHKPQGVVRILIVGDSHTYGLVRLEDIYPRQLEILLHERGYTNAEVISVGVCGWGTDQELEFLIREGFKYQPDFVICQFCINDLLDNAYPDSSCPPESFSRFKPFKYILKNGELEKIELERLRLNARSKIIGYLRKTAVIYNLEKLIRSNFGQDKLNPDEQVSRQREVILKSLKANSIDFIKLQEEACWQLLTALFAEMKRLCSLNDCELMIFSESGDPARRQWYIDLGLLREAAEEDIIDGEGDSMEIDFFRSMERLKQACRELDITLIDQMREYRRYKSNPHANAEGHLNMASDIADFLSGYEIFFGKF